MKTLYYSALAYQTAYFELFSPKNHKDQVYLDDNNMIQYLLAPYGITSCLKYFNIQKNPAKPNFIKNNTFWMSTFEI